MENLTIEQLEGGVTRLTLNSGSGNPLSPALVSELSQALVDLGAAPPGAVVLAASGDRIFSGGFDLPSIGEYDRENLLAFFQGFLGVMDRMLRLPCPIVAAVNGHAIAGGFILTLACDLRVVGNSPKKLGLSEVDLGAAVPAGTQLLLAERTTPQVSRRLSQTAQLIGPEEAARVGYADELADDPNGRAVELAQRLAAKPGCGVATTKQLLGHQLADRIAAADDAGLEAFIASWFSPEAQAGIAGLVARLRGES